MCALKLTHIIIKLTNTNISKKFFYQEIMKKIMYNIICLILLLKGFVKMQGTYNKLVESNKDFIEMMDELTTSHETQKKEENARRISEMSSKNISIFRRISEMTIASSIVVRQLLYTLREEITKTLFDVIKI